MPSTKESFHLLRNVSRHARNTQHIFLIFFLSSRSTEVAHIQKFPAQILENTGVTDTLIQNHLQVKSPTGSPTTRSLMKRRILLALKTIRLPKLRVMPNLCPTTSHCCLPLKILLKSLLCVKKQTRTTNKFVLCWLHHGAYQSEKQVRNDCKFMTLKEKA